MRPGVSMSCPTPSWPEARPVQPFSIFESPSAAARLDAASRFVNAYPPGTEILIAAASRQAADDFVRDLAAGTTRATFGLRRFSLLQLAAFVAAPDLAARGLAPASALGVQAITTRAAFDARRDHALIHFAPIADRPGFPSALADTLADLRGAAVAAASLPASDPCLADLAGLLARFEAHLHAFSIADPATLFHLAATAVREGRAPGVARLPLLLLDVPVETQTTDDFVSALVGGAPRTLVTIPANDNRTLEWLRQLRRAAGQHPPPVAAAGQGQLAQVQNRLFQLDLRDTASFAPAADARQEVDFFSAPGEGREAVEIARRVLVEARAGTRFDRMAVLLRAPQVYGSLVETSFRRAGIPAWFARGTRRPNPSGRAFLALLACTLERLSARRFAEYLSLGEVPAPLPAGEHPAMARWIPAGDELLLEPAAIGGRSVDAPPPISETGDPTQASTTDEEDGRPVVAGTLRAPWRWEELLVEAAVVGSRDRWQRRLDGLARDFDLRLQAAESEDADSPRAAAARRDLRNLDHLRQFALPVVDRLAALPARTTWGEWLDHLDALAPLVLRSPERVLAVLAELRPMSDVGPVTLEEVHRVLATHLSQLREEPSAYRYGAVFVGTPEQARGRAFDVVFVPGLAERVFPQRAREDPLLVDDRRRLLPAALPLRRDVTGKERLLLQVAVGAASRRLYLSYPSMDLVQARARVPSFYALDVERARTGRVPDFEVLAGRAQRSGGARLAWPAPADPARAIDAGERDLAVLGGLLRLQQQDRAAARGRARFLLGLNSHLARALRARWLRAQRLWSAADGLYNAGADARACLAAHRLRARPYSVSALQRFATCPYQFLLGAIHRLEPRPDIAWLEQLDPLQRGEIFHRVQADFVRWLAARPTRLDETNRGAALDFLNRLLDSVADRVLRRARARDRTRVGERDRVDALGFARLVAASVRFDGRVAAATRRTGVRVRAGRGAGSRERGRPGHAARRLATARPGRSRRTAGGRRHAARDGSQDRSRADRGRRDCRRWRGAPAGALRDGGGTGARAGGSGRPPLLLHPGRRVRRATRAARRAGPAQPQRGARDHRPGDRAGLAAARTPRRRVPVLRLSRGVRPGRGAPGRTQGPASPRRCPLPETPAMNAPEVLDDAADRQAIRDHLDATLIVEAAAGTGKTTELVNRIVEILATGRASVQQIVAVTFTEKAAGELKLRLREALERARNASQPAPDRSARLEDALAHLEEAHVSTIHGFCAELLRERPVEAAVDPRFDVMLEPDARRLYRRAFDGWLQEVLEDPPEGVRRSLRRRAGAQDEGPRARLREAGWTLASWRDFSAPWRADLFDRDSSLRAVVEVLHGFAGLSAAAARPTDNLYADTRAARDLSDRIRAMEAAGRDDNDAIEAALVDLSREPTFTRARKGYGARYGNGVSRAAVQEAHAALVTALFEFREAADADLAARLQHELAAPNARYESLKHQGGRLDFVDLLLRARDLIRDHDQVRAAFQSRFARIFVDEFQDTDPLQAELLMLLASIDPAVRDWRAVQPASGKLFVVGDPKQSIYRFRRADVGIYQEVKDQLRANGAGLVTLRTSFRSLPAIQRVVNAAFGPQMQGDRATLQADYVPLKPYRRDGSSQPSVVVLPVPRPYGTRRISARAIDDSLPDAVCAFVDWLVTESHWMVAEREEGWREPRARPGDRGDAGESRVPVSPRHVCVLFRRFETWGTDVTRPYVEGLQARGIAHLLVGGRSFHAREEVEAMRAALTAIEWPDGALDVFATLHGPLFAVPDEALLEYRERFGRLHPFRAPSGAVPERLAPIVDALGVLRELHRTRNHVPVDRNDRATAGGDARARRTGVAAIGRAGARQRAAPRRTGARLRDLVRRVLVPRLHRSAGRGGRGGRSGRGADPRGRRRRGARDDRAQGEGPGVPGRHPRRHDSEPGAWQGRPLRGRRTRPVRGPDRRLVAARARSSTKTTKLARDRAEAIRVAYVAATRARDLLVVPGVGDTPYDDKWLSPLNAAIYPPVHARRIAEPALSCPRFGKDTVLERPDGYSATGETVCPGLHRLAGGPGERPPSRAPAPSDSYSVVWWDPRVLALGAPSPQGIRAEDLIGKDADAVVVEGDMREYETWQAERDSTLARAATPSLVVRTVTAHAVGQSDCGHRRSGGRRPARAGAGRSGHAGEPTIAARLGMLAHASLASAPLDADAQAVERGIALQARILGATEEECRVARSMVAAALSHPLLDRARACDRVGCCRRETPVTLVDGEGALVEGVVDLAFEEADGWTVVDFKTTRELTRGLDTHKRQVALYAQAIASATGRPARGVLMYL